MFNIVPRLFLATACLITMFFSGSVMAVDHAIGSRTLNSGLIPPVEESGMALVLYNQYYDADILGTDGSDTGADLTVASQAYRFIWMTDTKLFGADYMMNIAVPLVHLKVDGMAPTQTFSGMGDIFFEPFMLSWHKEYVDLILGLGSVLPFGGDGITGDHFSFVTTLGITLHDKERKWNLSFVPAFEIHGPKQGQDDYREGNDFHIEWGLGRQFGPLNVGISGYHNWQVSSDSGTNANGPTIDAGDEQVHAIGLSAQYFSQTLNGMFELLVHKEYDTKNAPEGSRIYLNFNRAFF